MAFVDHCNTAEDVRNQAVINQRRLVASRAPIKPKVITVTVTTFDYLPKIPFNKLVSAAYPLIYPFKPLPKDTIKTIQDLVARHFKVTRNDLISERRQKEFVIPRMIAVALAKELTSLSYPSIGKLFGGRDHTTILHSIRRMAPAMEEARAMLPRDAAIWDWVEAASSVASRTLLTNAYQHRRAQQNAPIA